MSYESNPIIRLADLEAPSVIMMVGVPGSGKSYIASQLSELLSMPVISSDACREELSGDANDQSVSRQAWELVYKKARAAIEADQSVIIDGTHKSREQRRTDSARYRSYGARTVAAVQVSTTLATAFARNASRERVVPEFVIEGMHAAIATNPPTQADGFDYVVKLDNNPTL